MFESSETQDKHNERYHNHRPNTFFEVRESSFQKAAVSYRLIYDSSVVMKYFVTITCQLSVCNIRPGLA